MAFVYVNADSDMTVKQDLHFSQINTLLPQKESAKHTTSEAFLKSGAALEVSF